MTLYFKFFFFVEYGEIYKKIIIDFWLVVILTIAAEAIITILIVDYLGQKEKDDENVK